MRLPRRHTIAAQVSKLGAIEAPNTRQGSRASLLSRGRAASRRSRRKVCCGTCCKRRWLVPGAPRLVPSTHHEVSIALVATDAGLLSLVSVDERSDGVPDNRRRILELAACLERQHRRLVPRLQSIQQGVRVHARRRLLLGVLEERSQLVHFGAVGVEGLAFVLAQRRPPPEQFADAVFFRALKLGFQPVPEAVRPPSGDVSGLCSQLLGERRVEHTEHSPGAFDGGRHEQTTAFISAEMGAVAVVVDAGDGSALEDDDVLLPSSPPSLPRTSAMAASRASAAQASERRLISSHFASVNGF